MSDLHLDFAEMEYPNTDADVIVLAGDIAEYPLGAEWASKLADKGIPVIYVTGNHEYYGGCVQKVDLEVGSVALNNMFGREKQLLYFMNTKEDEPITIGDATFIGGTLWTDFNILKNQPLAMVEAGMRMNDYRQIKYAEWCDRFVPLTPQQVLNMHTTQLALIQNFIKDVPESQKIVIVTHHAPSLQSVSGRYKDDRCTPAYATDLEYMMGDRIKLWIHGHVHCSNDYTINGTRVMSNPRGYAHRNAGAPENKDFNPNLVVEI